MAFRSYDKWLWIGLGIFVCGAIKMASSNLDAVIQMDVAEQANPKRGPKLNPKKNKQPEDDIPLDVLATLSNCPTYDIREAATKVIATRFASSTWCLSQTCHEYWATPSRRATSIQVFRLLERYNLIHPTSEFARFRARDAQADDFLGGAPSQGPATAAPAASDDRGWEVVPHARRVRERGRSGGAVLLAEESEGMVEAAAEAEEEAERGLAGLSSFEDEEEVEVEGMNDGDGVEGPEMPYTNPVGSIVARDGLADFASRLQVDPLAQFEEELRGRGFSFENEYAEYAEDEEGNVYVARTWSGP